MEKWVVFYHNRHEMAAYTLKGTFPGELEETKSLLAYEYGIEKEDIEIRIEERKKTMRKEKRYYLAYGSNLSEEQMEYRCPDATIVGTANIEDYRLMYKGSKTGAYATIEPEKGQKVPVLVWDISPGDEGRLDLYEGYPTFYYKKALPVEITSLAGKPLGRHVAMVYIMDEKRAHGMPGAYYEEILRLGYKRFGFDEEILDEALRYTALKLYGKEAVK